MFQEGQCLTTDEPAGEEAFKSEAESAVAPSRSVLP